MYLTNRGKRENASYMYWPFYLSPHCLQVFLLIVTNTSLTNNKFLDRTIFKAFTDNKLNVANVMISVFDRVENIVGKDGTMFSIASSLWFIEIQDCVIQEPKMGFTLLSAILS